MLRLVFLLSAGDVERNPDPKKQVYKHPCGVCQSPVRSNKRGILCEVCYKWFHTKCIGVSNDDYSRLQQSDEAWCCKTCLKEALPYHNTSDGSIFDTSASSILSNSFNFQDDVNSNPNNPKTTSPYISTTQSLSLFYYNCLIPKIDNLRALAATHAPDVILLCEIWLDSTISINELFIPNYSISRRDRNRHGGGVATVIIRIER